MPQLSGPEQKVLVDLLAEHLTEPSQLDRSLLHAGLGNLARYSSKGTLDAIVSDVVRELAAQFRIGELVEAVLNGDFLKGQCPPMEAWLAANREELQRRKLGSGVGDRLRRPSNPWILRCGALSVATVLLWWGYLNYKPELEPFRGELIPIASLTVLGELEHSRSTQILRDLQKSVQSAADAGEYGFYYLSNPLESALDNPTVEVNASDRSGMRLEDREAIVEIFWLPPDRDHEKSGQAGPQHRLSEGFVRDRYDGRAPAASIIVLFYHRPNDKYGPPTFRIRVK